MQNSATKDISTVGIVVSDWTYFKPVKESQTGLKGITFMTWDFGGQEEYYATHQCFLSRRSLYLAVWDVTHGMGGVMELKSWLLNIQVRTCVCVCTCVCVPQVCRYGSVYGRWPYLCLACFVLCIRESVCKKGCMRDRGCM